MKKFLSITLALALLGGSTTAALAHGRPGYGPPIHRGYYAQPYGYGHGYGYRRDNSAAALGMGLFAFGLIATLAAQNNAAITTDRRRHITARRGALRRSHNTQLID
jgi:hypothetical protein